MADAINTTHPVVDLTMAVDLTLEYMRRNKPVFWWGPPGIGKTQGAYQLGEKLGRTVLDWRTNLREPVDARGLPMPDLENNVTKWLRPSDLPFEGSDFPEDTIVFMDEMNTGSPSMQVVAMQLIQERRVGEHRLKKGVYIMGAGNRQSDRAAAQRMPTALANRLAHIEIMPTVPSVTKHFAKKDLNPILLAFLRFRESLLLDMSGSDLRAFPTPRSWEDAEPYIDTPDTKRMYLLSGLVGQGAAAELDGFIRVYKSLPSLDLVLANPNSAPLPKEPAANFAIATGLAQKVTDRTLENAIVYLRRLPAREFEIMCVVDAVRRGPGLSHTSAFVEWACRNADVTIG